LSCKKLARKGRSQTKERKWSTWDFKKPITTTWRLCRFLQRKADMIARTGRMLTGNIEIETYRGPIMLYKELWVLVAGN
jgi:hypothetical protein